MKGLAAVTLSGMSNMERLKQNVATYAAECPLNDKEREGLLGVARAMMAQKTLPCTACHYCTPHCPQELNIPSLMRLYNEYVYAGGGFLVPMAVGALPEDKRPAACMECRSCEAVCPQGIKISEMMRDFTERLKK